MLGYLSGKVDPDTGTLLTRLIHSRLLIRIIYPSIRTFDFAVLQKLVKRV
jgi:hypothetical protein